VFLIEMLKSRMSGGGAYVNGRPTYHQDSGAQVRFEYDIKCIETN
jgi:hypothetical protein